jgi:hypothetical protein
LEGSVVGISGPGGQIAHSSELVRWMFGFWVSTLLGITGLPIALGDR